jgi:uncharacterized protein (DUF342 family)
MTMRSRSIVLKGKTVNEAIENGLVVLGTTRNNVDIEIIELENKGLLGIRKKPAVVKLIEREPLKEITNEAINGAINEDNLFNIIEKEATDIQLKGDLIDGSTTDENLEGKAWVKDDQIFCKDSLTQYPTITPTAGIDLYKNGRRERDTTIIMESDLINIVIEEEILETKWEIKVDRDKLIATLNVQPGYRKVRKLNDHKPTNHIKLAINESVIPNNTLALEDVLEKLLELNVVHSINYNEIQNACDSVEKGIYEIARGIEPQLGKNGWLEYNIDLDKELPEPKERPDGSIDYREIKHIPSVDKGQIICVIHSSIPGKPGVTVTGQTIPPKASYDLIIRNGKGVDLIKDGTQLVATASGRPQFQQRGTLVQCSILPKLFHPQDVDLSSGNIHFIGDVEVAGSINEKMKVEAAGDVLIRGNVNMANVKAGNSIFINRNIIGSELTAGMSNMIIAEASQVLEEIAVNIKTITTAIDQLYNSPAFKTSDFTKIGLSSLIKILLDQKFKSFPGIVKKFVEKVNKGRETIDKEWISLADSLYNNFVIYHPQGFQSVQDLIELGKEVDQLYDLSTLEPEPNSKITVPYVLNSQIYCSGDVSIVGQGCYNSHIHAMGQLSVKGFLRGGEYYAGMGAQIGETGSKKGGVSTKIIVPKDQKIKIDLVMEDTILQIGKRIYKFRERQKFIVAKLNDDGEIVLFS